MSSPQRTTNLSPRSDATKEMLVRPPFSGSSATGPRQHGSWATLPSSFRMAADPSKAIAAYTRLVCPREETMPDSHARNTITGPDAFLRVLSDEGVSKMFGNPGTTELPIMHALSSAPEMGYVLGLQEAVVIAMADGYARASGKLVSCNVHVAPGLGNAVGSLYTSLVS